MPSLADLQRMRDALHKNRMNGIRSWRDQNGEEITYSSDREMAAALAALDREIALATGGRLPSKVIFRTSKGL